MTGMKTKKNKETDQRINLQKVHCYIELSVVLVEFCISKTLVKLFIVMAKALFTVIFILSHFTTKLRMLRHTIPIKKCATAPTIGLYIFSNASLSHFPGT